MKILVAANNISNDPRNGGSSRFMKCLIDELENQGHTVLFDKAEECDLVICSHSIDESINAKKIFISHGIIDEERCPPGADKYVSISEELRTLHRSRGFNSIVINQPIDILPLTKLNSSLKNILVIRDDRNIDNNPFDFLSEYYNVRYSSFSTPIESQIAWADLCITLGRGALESMAQGTPVLVADNRKYIGAFGDGYVTSTNVNEIAKNNFSGRRFKIPLTEEWILDELSKYSSFDGLLLHEYVSLHHDVKTIVNQYLKEFSGIQSCHKEAFGCMINDMKRFDLILKGSSIQGHKCFTVFDPESAAKGLNTLLDCIENSGAEIGILTHQDMFYRDHWMAQVREQLAKLPEDWVIAGVVGKDTSGKLCGRFHDMSSPLWIMSEHDFPVQCSCIDECTILVNMKTGFRFDEALEGFDLYGTYACLRAGEMGSAWIIDAWAEHYCKRFFGSWEPDERFQRMWKWLYNRFPGKRLESTVLIGEDL